jgi:hypothetical protein
LFATCPGSPIVCGILTRAAGLLCADIAVFNTEPPLLFEPPLAPDLLLLFPAIVDTKTNVECEDDELFVLFAYLL